MQLRGLLILAAVAGTSGILVKSGDRLDINQKVYIENQAVLGDGVPEPPLGVCTNFAPQHVSNADAPKVKVCGQQIKATIYLRGDPPAHHQGTDCREYYQYQWTVGKCDTGLPSTQCDEISPAQDSRIGAAQSYIIEHC